MAKLWLWAWQITAGRLLFKDKKMYSEGVCEHWQQQVAIINNPDINECANNGASGYLHLFRIAHITSSVCWVVFPGWFPDNAEHSARVRRPIYALDTN